MLSFNLYLRLTGWFSTHFQTNIVTSYCTQPVTGQIKEKVLLQNNLSSFVNQRYWAVGIFKNFHKLFSSRNISKTRIAGFCARSTECSDHSL